MASARFQELDWYETPAWYDLVFDQGTEREADFLEAMRARHGQSRGRRVLEPACGSGRLLEALARRGYGVCGFDLSTPMLDFARQRLARSGLRARLFQARLEDFSVPGRFDLAHCLVSTFKYVLEEGAARSHLRAVARALAPGGIYVLGFHLSDYQDSGRSRERWVARDGETEVVCNIQGWPADRRRRRERVRSRLLVRDRQGERRAETCWWFRTYDAAQVRRLFRSVPELEHVATHDFDHDPGRERELDDRQLDCVFVLRRRSGPGGDSTLRTLSPGPHRAGARRGGRR